MRRRGLRSGRDLGKVTPPGQMETDWAEVGLEAITGRCPGCLRDSIIGHGGNRGPSLMLELEPPAQFGFWEGRFPELAQHAVQPAMLRRSSRVSVFCCMRCRARAISSRMVFSLLSSLSWCDGVLDLLQVPAADEEFDWAAISRQA